MSIYAFCGAALLLAVCGYLLSSFGWRGVPLLCIVFILLFLGRVVGTLFPALISLCEAVPAGEPYVKIAVKILGIAYLGEVTADICHELGALSAEKVTVSAARTEMILLTLPYFLDILKTGISLL